MSYIRSHVLFSNDPTVLEQGGVEVKNALLDEIKKRNETSYL